MPNFAFNGVYTQYDDPTNVIDPQILAVAAVPTLGAFEAVIWNRLLAPEKALVNDKFEIYSRTDGDLSGAIGDGAATGWNNSATTGLPIQSDYVSVLLVGSVIKVGSEIVVVKSIDRSAETISVYKRGHGGTTPAAHNDGDTFEVIGSGINDLDAKNVDSRGEKTVKWTNYAQLIFEPIEYSFTSETDARKAFQTAPTLTKEALNRVFRMLARSLILGQKEAPAAGVPATTAGILQQLSDATGRTPIRVNANSGAFSETLLRAAIEEAVKKGNPNAIYLSQTNKKVADGFAFAKSDVVIAAGGETLSTRGLGSSAQYYEYMGRRFEFVFDSNMPNDRVEIVNENKITRGFRLDDALRLVAEPPQSSREFRTSVQGKFGVSVEDVGREHADIYGIVPA